MSKILESVDARTQLVGENRLELLMFNLTEGSLFGINVFKVQEVQQVSKLHYLPHRHPVVCGVTHTRGETIPVIDLSKAIGLSPIKELEACNIIISEYNQTVQAFVVASVDRIVNINWNEVRPPPLSAGPNHYLTAITQLDNHIVEILDVEKVLSEITPFNTSVSSSIVDKTLSEQIGQCEVLVIDDSIVGATQARESLEFLGINVSVERNGRLALDHLKDLVAQGIDVTEKYLMIVTDAEMPEMDGYRFTTECREDQALKDLFIVLHTSLSGSFNEAMVKKVGCDDFLSKFESDALAKVAQDRLRDVIKLKNT